MLNRRVLIVSAFLVLNQSFPVPAFADPVKCQVNAAMGTCSINAGGGGSPGGGGGPEGGPAPQGAGGSGSGPQKCMYDGKEISCTAPGNKNQAYFSSDLNFYCSFQDPGPTPGTGIFSCYPPGSRPERGSTQILPLSGPGAPAVPPPPDPRVLAQQAISQMGLRHIAIGMAPPPGAGKVGVIGLPTWMWVADPGAQTTGPQTQSASQSGYTVTATATLNDITWSMGDGGSVVCHGAGTAYSAAQGSRPSPDCGYTFTKSGDFTVTATSHWNVAWSGIGQSGVIPLTFTSSTQVTEVELQAIGQR